MRNLQPDGFGSGVPGNVLPEAVETSESMQQDGEGTAGIHPLH